MSRLPPIRRPDPDLTGIVVGAPVSGSTWTQLGQLGNWLNGKGASHVAGCAPLVRIDATKTQRFRFYTHTRAQAIERLWFLDLRTVGSTSLVTIQGTNPGAVARLARINRGTAPIVYEEALSAQARVEGEIALDITAGESDVLVYAIACHDQDRAILQQNTSDFAVDTFTLGSRQPILCGSYVSTGGAHDAIACSDARRVGLYHWTQGDVQTASTYSSAYTNILELGAPLLASKLYRGDTKAPVCWAFYGYAVNGSETLPGYVRLVTSHSGVVDEVRVTHDSQEWSIPRIVEVDCEDLETLDGLQGGSWDLVTPQIAGPGSAPNNMILQSLSIWTPDRLRLLDLTRGTYSRASVATYQTGASTVAHAASGELRREHRGDGKSSDLVLLEPRGNTNHVAFANDLASWDIIANGAGVMDNHDFAPDGTKTASLLTLPSGGSSVGDRSQVRINLPTIPNVSLNCTISFWAKAVSGDGRIQARLHRREASPTYSGSVPYDFTATGQWQRFSTSQWAGNTGPNTLQLALLNADNSGSRELLIWGVQVEDGNVGVNIYNPSSLMLTDGATAILPAPDAITWGTAGGAITVTTGQSDPYGGTKATLLNEIDPVGEQASASTAGTHVSGSPVSVRIKLKKDTSATNTVGVETRAGGTGSVFVLGGVVVHLGTGQIETYGAGYSNASCNEEVTGWWTVRFDQTGSGLIGTSLNVRVRPAIGLASAFPARSPAVTGAVTVYGPQITYANNERAGESLTFEAGEYPDTYRTDGFSFTFAPQESSADMIARLNGWQGALVGFDANNYLRFYNQSSQLYIDAQATGETELLPAPGSITWTASGVVVTTGQADPYGGTNAVNLNDDSNTTSESAFTNPIVPRGEDRVRVRVWLKKNAAATWGTDVMLRRTVGGTATNMHDVRVRIDTGAFHVPDQTQISDVSCTEAIPGWWLLEYTHSGADIASAEQLQVRVYPANIDLAVWPSTGGGAPIMGSVTVYAPQISYLHSQTVSSSSLSFSAHQPLTIEVSPSLGRLRLNGCTTGNGEYTGTPWTWPSGTMKIGDRPEGTSQPINGRWSRYMRGL